MGRLICLAMVLAFGAIAGATEIGSAFVGNGMEIIPSYQTGIVLDHTPSAMGANAEDIYLRADVHATKQESHGFADHAFVPYLSISYVLTKDGTPTFKKAGLLYPTVSLDGPHYGAMTAFDGPGTYHLIYLISPPSSHGVLRQVDNKTLVPPWWNAMTANWTFSYTPVSP